MTDKPRDSWGKLVRWNADFYNELTDDDCIVCLTERQIYLIHEMLMPLRWSRTRWTGDTTGLDFDLIASNLQHALDERMTCEKLTQLLEQVQILTDIVINGDTIPAINVSTTTIDDVMDEAARIAAVLAETENCDAADKDALYGACKVLVAYINQENADFLQQVSQQGGAPENLARLISAIPGVGLLPIDELVEWSAFIAQELEEEYEATVDAELLETFVCDLFCLAVDNDCSLNLNILLNHVFSKLPSGLDGATTVLLDLAQFALLGTMSGDDYFWYMTFIQLWVASTGQVWFGQHGIERLQVATLSGLDQPDDDWALLCDCPEPVEPFEPLITHNVPCSVAGQSAGTIVGEQSPGVWRVSSTHRNEGNDECVTLADASGRLFKITSSVKISGADIFSWTKADANCATANGFNLDYGNAEIKNIILTATNGNIWTYDLTIELVL
jgi:hypothetical protein